MYTTAQPLQLLSQTNQQNPIFFNLHSEARCGFYSSSETTFWQYLRLIYCSCSDLLICLVGVLESFCSCFKSHLQGCIHCSERPSHHVASARTIIPVSAAYLGVTSLLSFQHTLLDSVSFSTTETNRILKVALTLNEISPQQSKMDYAIRSFFHLIPRQRTFLASSRWLLVDIGPLIYPKIGLPQHVDKRSISRLIQNSETCPRVS